VARLRRRAQENQKKAHTRALKAKLVTRRDAIKKCQTAFNAYIRERDKGKPCICCGAPLGGGHETGGGYDCGHYRSIGSAPHLRFDEDNANAQRKQCNRWGSGRAVDYRLGLIERIGLNAVERIESDQESRKWTKDELLDMAAGYRAKLREMKKNGTSEP
jgi:hypothetical protein